MELSDRELATVLAALRHWQAEEMPARVSAALQQSAGIEHDLDGFFYDAITPLTLDEIDELCERINTRQPAAQEEA